MQLTFLQIVQKTHREAGFQGTIASVLNQTGRASDVVGWVQGAYEELQMRRRDWDVDWAQGSYDLTAGKDTYDPAVDWGIAGGIRNIERQGMYVYRVSAGLASRAWVRYLDWPISRELAIPPLPGFPLVITRKPDGTIYFYPVPQENLKAVMEYWRHPQQLAADADIPRIPVDYHMAIVWKAVMAACDVTKDWSRRDSAEERYEALVGPMERQNAQPFLQAGPLA